ncbi:MAG: hypothetical protein FWF63_01670 [Fibromonadales bacterium]|nr:hypothetical protein [Fibromonadales bacterium]
MKKFFVPLFLALLLSCSNEGFKSDIASSAQKDVDCWVIIDNECKFRQISEILCNEIGVQREQCPEVSSSSDEDISSSSRNAGSSSSRNAGSSSSRNAGSSSSRNAVSSSSGDEVSSSSGDEVSSSSDDEVSSSSDDAVSSSSGGAVSSSSGGATSSSSVVNSSSSVGAVSSSSSGAISSSSSSVVSSSSSEPLPAPAWTDCNIPQYVGRNEPIANLKFISIENNNGRCGTITYRLNSTGQGQPATTLNYNNNQIGTNQTLNITASATCSGGITLNQKSCSKQVTVADYAKFSEVSTDVILKSGKTVVDVGGVPADMFGCQARDNSTNPSPNPFEGKTSFILDGKTVSVTDNTWWVKTAITGNRMLFESNNANVGSYRCQIE